MPSSSRARHDVRWVGLSPDDRRRARRRLLLTAAYELLGTEGWSRTTVRGVCQQARLNARYFYESFSDLDELLVAVYDHVVEEMRDSVLEAAAIADDDLETQVRTVIDSIVGFIDDDPRRGQILYVEALGNEALNRRRIETGHALVDLVEQDAIARHGKPPAHEPLGRISAAILVGGFSELLGAWLDGRIKASRAQLVDDATALFLALGDTAVSMAVKRSKRPRAARRATTTT